VAELTAIKGHATTALPANKKNIGSPYSINSLARASSDGF
jgi:hypothetical protein